MSIPKDRIVSKIQAARKELEDVLYELEKLPLSTGSSVRFTAHALNNLLSVTAGTVQLLQMSLADYSDPQIQKWLEGLVRTTKLMAETVNKLMDMPTDHETRLHFEKVDLLCMVHRFSKYYQRIAEEKGIRITYDSSVDIPLAWADRVITAAVLDNLLSNAVKYSKPGTCIEIQITVEEDWVKCSVCDQGPGISEEDQKRLFQPGSQLTAKPTGGEPSTGYGLAVAKSYVERLGGSIWCDSVVGKGSCFTFTLPKYKHHFTDQNMDTDGNSLAPNRSTT